MPTAYPLLAAIKAVAAPMPLPAPVMMRTLFMMLAKLTQ
jgi:hypothetical protein